MNIFKKNLFSHTDFVTFFSAVALSLIGLSVIFSFGESNAAFFKQSISLSIAIVIFFIASNIDIYFLKNSRFISLLYFISVGLFLLLIVLGSAYSGAQSWFSLGFFAFQPTDLSKLVLVFILAKYFYKRHVEISRIRHLFVSGTYAGILFILLAFQPDFGSAMIVFFI